ncbi:Helix-turn-helix [Pedococcus cremeus]|uniref:Helix-turn-helix n=1 Tax=Pedococcus cremeus TaxID=587636 RepID=A0A1H9VL82_9MICO|nr:helix-turn-helix transcriptional regulator [Pedococcus cremeus]SES22349.1 Helix-turn-helix [Pedococcus cremeus]
MRQIPLGNHLGDYLREQRQSARLSLRQLADLAGISNPYLSQIERGLKKPSAEILQQLAKGLQVSAESLYVRAGILDERPHAGSPAIDTRGAISVDPHLTDRQKSALLDIYDSFVGAPDAPKEEAERPNAEKAKAERTTDTPSRRRSTRSGKAATAATAAKGGKGGKGGKAVRPAAAAVTTKKTTKAARPGPSTTTPATSPEPQTSTEKE